MTLRIPPLPLGKRGTVEKTVRPEDTADFQGYKGVPVLSTPSLFLWMELACAAAVEGLLPPGLKHVGTRTEARHLAATPIGMKVTAEAELVEVDGRRLVFRCQARDPVEVIGEGIHERWIVDWKQFCRALEEKEQTCVSSQDPQFPWKGENHES